MQARHHIFVYPFFKHLGSLLLHSYFREAVFTGPPIDPDRPLLLISNHISWWDGCWNFYFTEAVLHRRFYFMAGSEQLEQHPFMKQIGGFPLKSHSRQNLKTIACAVRLLQNKNNAVLLYPEGKITSIYRSPFRFAAGTDHLLRLLPPDTQLLLMAYFCETGHRLRPGVWGYYTIRNNNPSLPLNEIYQNFYKYYLNIHIQNLSE